MAKLPVRPKWQTTTCFFFGMAVFMFEVGLNAVTGREANASIIGAAVGIMLGGPVLNKSASRKERNDNDDSDAD
jgi:hypothetical protein